MSAADQLPLEENLHLKKSAFSVPDDYFNLAKNQLLTRVKLQESVSSENHSGFKTPFNYQDLLSGKILSAVAEEKIKEKIPTDGFTLPENYFETFGHRLKAKTSPKTQVKIYQLNWFKQAIAACVILGFSFSLMLGYQQNNNFEKQLSAIPDDTIVNYLNLNTDLSDMPIIIENSNDIVLPADNQQNLSSEEIEQYLNSSI